MELPKYNELYAPFLTAIADGNMHTIKEIRTAVARMLRLSEEDLSLRLPSGSQPIFDNRLAWAKTYLKKAGMLIAPQRAHFQITAAGKALLACGQPITNGLLAEKSPEFATFAFKEKRENASPAEIGETAPAISETHRQRLFYQ